MLIIPLVVISFSLYVNNYIVCILVDHMKNEFVFPRYM